MDTNQEIMYRNLTILARCYSTADFEPLFPILSEDVSLTSTWVLETLLGKEKVKDYYVGKGETVRKCGTLPECKIVRSTVHSPGKLLIYMSQKLESRTVDGVIVANFNGDGMIREINLCDKNFYPFEFIEEPFDSKEWAEWFQDHSMKMRAHSGNYSLSHEMRSRRAEIFQQTMRLVDSGEYVSEKNNCIQIPDPEPMMAGTVFYDKEFTPDRKQNYDQMEISVQNNDCVLAGQQLKQKGFDPAILNMASGRNPGGGVIHGAGAQEENLFRRSNLFKSMYQFAEYASMYNIPKSEDQYPLDFHFGGIYTPDAFFFRGLETDGYPLLDDPISLSVISVAAINLTGHDLSVQDYLSTTRDKIRTIFRIGIDHGHDALVLSAFGCGAFGNDPYVMASLFLEVLHEPEFEKAFRKIVFAVIDDHNSKGNYASFCKIIH